MEKWWAMSSGGESLAVGFFERFVFGDCACVRGFDVLKSGMLAGKFGTELMMKTSTYVSLGLALVGLSAGCSGDGATGSPGAVLARADCERAQRCFPASFLEFRDMSQCVKRNELASAFFFQLPGVSISSAGAAACAEAIRNADCGVSVGMDPACQFTGTLGNGVACIYGEQCASGYCEEGEYDCGVCSTPPRYSRKGESCEDTWCEPDLECDYYNDSFTCFARVGLGDSCNELYSSEEPRRCKSGLLCDNGICVARGKIGDKCDYTRYCEGTLWCEPVESAEYGVCRATTTVGLGEDCGVDQICQAGLYCDWDEGDCRAFVHDGAACTSYSECLYPSDCLFDDEYSEEGTCQYDIDDYKHFYEQQCLQE